MPTLLDSPTALDPPSTETRSTQHGLLVAFGHFAAEIGLLAQLPTVPIPQKTVTHTPAAKLTTFFMGLLTGMEYLTDLTHAPAPLYHDPEVARAWGFAALPEASGVSRTLTACTAESLAALERALDTVTQPFLQRALTDVRTRNQPILLDADLTGQPLSPGSTTYPDAAFGYMDGAVHLGYQLAEICLHTELYGRQWLVGQQHPGDTVSAPCLLELVAAEQRLGCHPRRRVELLDTRITEIEETVAAWDTQADAYLAQAETLLTRIGKISRQLHTAECTVWRLKRNPQSTRQSGPYGALTRAEQQVTRYQARLDRLEQRRTDRLHQVRRYRAGVRQQEQQLAALQARREMLAAENAAQSAAPRCRLRMDAGFSSGENLTALLELGYEIETKAANAGLIHALQRQAVDETAWTRVGQNAAMIGWTNYTLPTCPYPVTVGLERFHTPQGLKYAVLLRSPDDPTAPCPDLRAWFREYNRRGTIEAGIKQSKTVFHVQHPMSRTRSGMQIQVALTLFAANFVTWAQTWLQERRIAGQGRVSTGFARVKHLVRIAANSPAVVEQGTAGVWVRFSAVSSLVGVVLALMPGPTGQLELPLFPRGVPQ
jgi:hypothetical protein